MKLKREELSLIFNSMPAGCSKYLEETDVDVICGRPRVFTRSLDDANNQVFFHFLIQLRFRFGDVGAFPKHEEDTFLLKIGNNIIFRQLGTSKQNY